MISTKDKVLKACRPENIMWDEYMIDCESAVNTSEIHSDELSVDDEALANEERVKKLRPERISRTNSVIRVHEKPWRSSRVSNKIMM